MIAKHAQVDLKHGNDAIVPSNKHGGKYYSEIGAPFKVEQERVNKKPADRRTSTSTRTRPLVKPSWLISPNSNVMKKNLPSSNSVLLIIQMVYDSEEIEQMLSVSRD